MSGKRRVAEKNLGVFLSPSVPGGGGFLVPMDNLNVGPGKPGPEDEWEVPPGPAQAEGQGGFEPAHSDGRVVPQDHPR